MKPTSLTELAGVMGASLHRSDGSDVFASGASVDTRTLKPGDLFFAMRGERTDGTDFARAAVEAGAAAVVAERPLKDAPTIVVEDVLEALQAVARWNLTRPDAFESPLVVGITGSVGKTTTKDALTAILRSAGRRVSSTVGNFNNEIGLPLTVLAADQRTEVLVLEMGATHVGNIAELCQIAPPDIGLLTAVAPAHLESFGSLERLAATKGELADSLPAEGSLVSPAGVPDSAVASGRELGGRIVFAGERREGANLWASDVEDRDEGLSFTAHFGEDSAEVHAPVFGTHLVEPLLAAIGGAVSVGVDLEEAARGLARIKRSGMRGDLYRLRDDVVIYDDSYNAASPVSMSAVLRYSAVAARRQNRRLVVILGGMFELGANTRAYHRQTGEVAREVGVDLLVCVGDEARWYTDAFDGESVEYPDAQKAAGEISGLIEPGDYVVVKGSRGVALETVTRKLRESLPLV